MYEIVKGLPTQGTDYVKDGVLYMGNIGGGVLIESEADLANLPEYRPGTLAHTAGWKDVWEMGTDGAWVSVTGGD